MQITLEIPDDSLSITRESPDEFARSLRIAAAVKWYELGRISQSKAAELIGCNRVDLFNHLRDYGVPFLQVSVADLEQELADTLAIPVTSAPTGSPTLIQSPAAQRHPSTAA